MIKMILKSHIFFLLVFVLGVSPTYAINPDTKNEPVKCPEERKLVNTKFKQRWQALNAQDTYDNSTSFFPGMTAQKAEKEEAKNVSRAQKQKPLRMPDTPPDILFNAAELDSSFLNLSVNVGDAVAPLYRFTLDNSGLANAVEIAWFLPNRCLFPEEAAYLKRQRDKLSKSSQYFDKIRAVHTGDSNKIDDARRVFFTYFGIPENPKNQATKDDRSVNSVGTAN